MWIERFELSGWRSFAHESPVVLEDCGAVNLLIGPNNVGKSNVQRFFHQLARGATAANLHEQRFDWMVPQRVGLHLAEDDVNWIGESPKVHAKIAYRRCEMLEPPILGLLDDGRFLVEIDARIGGYGYADVVNIMYPATGAPFLSRVSELPTDNHVPVTVTGEALKLSPGKGLPTELRKRLDDLLRAAFIDSVRLIGAQRNIDSSSKESSPVRLVPGAIAEELYRLKNSESKRWSKVSHDVEKWLARLLGYELLRIDFVNNGSGPTVQLELESHRGHKPPLIRLDALGTGVAEFFTILAFLRLRATSEPMVLFVDELEAHLHPSAVRELVLIIRKSFPNVQLFIATHSTDLLDAMGDDWRLYRFSMPEPWKTRVEVVAAKRDQLQLISDLGYRPSQLFLANAVVYVEGPSDALYIQALLRQVAPALLEGRDFVFLPYGGSNIRHVSYVDGGDSLVRLLECVQYPILVCDKDRADDDPLKPAVQRLRTEAKSLGLPVCLTRGYEIESIITNEALANAVSNLMQRARKYRGEIDPVKLDLGESLKTALAQAITPVEDAEEIAAHYAGRKVDIAREVTREVDHLTFSASGLELGREIRDAILRASSRNA